MSDAPWCQLKPFRIISLVFVRAIFCHLLELVYINPHMLKVILVTFVLKGGETTPRGTTKNYRLKRCKIPTATPMFLGSNISMVLSVTLPDETGSQKSKMAAESM